MTKPATAPLTLFLALLFLLSALPLPSQAGSGAPSTDPLPLPGIHYVHVAAADNIEFNWTYLDHPLLNGNNGAIFFATRNRNPPGITGPLVHDAVGLYYDGLHQRWSIYNQTGVLMEGNEAFNIHIPVEDDTVFVHEATPANTVDWITYINHPLLNGRPGASVFAIHNANPTGPPGVHNKHVIGVAYSAYLGQWYIFNQDLAGILDGATFNVLVASPDETAITHIATTENTVGYQTKIDDPRINGNPNALLTVTQNWYPHGVYNPHPIGLWYWDPYWYIFNQDHTSDIEPNAAFNILIPPTDSAAFVHVASGESYLGYYTRLDHPLLNGNPDAFLLATQNFSAGAPPARNNHHISLWYDPLLERWSIFNQDQNYLQEGTAFNVYVPPIGANTFTHIATPLNIAGNLTYIDHHESNGNPNVVALFTSNWNPHGLSGTPNDNATGIFYSPGLQQASIYNEDKTIDMPPEAAFNVFIPGDDAVVFVHTATPENIVSNWTHLDHPDLNGNPHALLYVTHNWNPFGSPTGEYNDQELGVWYNTAIERWAIFNQDDTVPMPPDTHYNVLYMPGPRIFLPLILR